MSKKKPEKVWMFYGSANARSSDKKPAVGTMGEYGYWDRKDGAITRWLGWSPAFGVYADEDKAKVTLFMKGFLACQAMYAEMFKEADDAD